MNGGNWQFSVESCDVMDKERLQAFRASSDIWVKSLDQDDQNSITSQILEMMWDDAAWRTLNHARFMSQGREDIASSSFVGYLLDKGYISNQVLAISRLLEPGAQRPHKQVNSLWRLVDEISSKRELITREIYVSRDGLPYDYQKSRASAFFPANGTAVWVATTGPEAWSQSKILHEEFDRLSGVDHNSRARTDLISISIFDNMAVALRSEVFTHISGLRNKVIAHAADKFSRGAGDFRNGMTLDEISRAHYILIGVFQALSANILYQSWLGTAVPTPLHAQFDYMDKPMVSTSELPQLDEFWQKHSGERDAWLSSAYQDFIPR